MVVRAFVKRLSFYAFITSWFFIIKNVNPLSLVQKRKLGTATYFRCKRMIKINYQLTILIRSRYRFIICLEVLHIFYAYVKIHSTVIINIFIWPCLHSNAHVDAVVGFQQDVYWTTEDSKNVQICVSSSIQLHDNIIVKYVHKIFISYVFAFISGIVLYHLTTVYHIMLNLYVKHPRRKQPEANTQFIIFHKTYYHSWMDSN